MPFNGSIVVIKRSGVDGSVFPLVNGDCLMGRAEGCDIRVQLPTVSEEHCRVEVNENDEARLVCLSENVGQTQLSGQSMAPGSSQGLYHKSIFTVGDRSFRWEYPPDSAHVSRKPESTQMTPRRVLTPNNGQIKGTTGARHNAVKTVDEFKKAIPKLGSTPRSSEALSAASKAIEQAVANVIPSPQALQTPKGAALRISSSKRVSFGPYVSPEIIDKTLPPSTPVKKGAEPLNLSLEASSNKTQNSKAISGNASARLLDTPSSLLKRNMKKKVSQHPQNESISEEIKPGVLKRYPNDTPMIKDNSGYRASPRRIDAMVANTPSIEQKTPIKILDSPTSQHKISSSEYSSPPAKNKRKLTKSTVKLRPAKSFYGSKAAETPKGAKRRASVTDDINPTAKRARVKTPAKDNASKNPTTKARALKLTKSTVKVKKANTFYGANAAKTPMGSRSTRRLSYTTKESGKTKLSTPQGRPVKRDLLKNETRITPKSASISKSKILIKKTPKPLWSEVVKKTALRKAMLQPKARKAQTVISKMKRPAKFHTKVQERKTIKRSGISTRHATSPETIVIRRKVKAKTPKVLAKVGKKTPSRRNATPCRNGPMRSKALTKKSKAKQTIQSPSNVTPTAAHKSRITANANKKSPRESNVVPDSSSESTPRRGKTPESSKIKSPRSASTSFLQLTESTPPLNETTFDFDSVKTPAIPLETFVSPLTLSRKKSPKMLSLGNTPDMRGNRKTITSPKNTKTPDLRGLKKLMATPKYEKTPKMSGMKQMLATPKNLATPDMRGLKEMLIPTKTPKTPRLAGLKQMLATPKSTKTPDMRGIKEMMISPKSQKTPRLAGMKQMFATQKDLKSPSMEGIKQMFNTPKSMRTPNMTGIREMMASPKITRTPRMAGIKQMFVTPKFTASPSYEGISSLLKTPSPVKLSPVKQIKNTSTSKDSSAVKRRSSSTNVTLEHMNSPKNKISKTPPTKRSARGTSKRITNSPTVPTNVDSPRDTTAKYEGSPVKRVSRRRVAKKEQEPPSEVKQKSPEKVSSPIKRVSRRKGKGRTDSPTKELPVVEKMESPSKIKTTATPVKRVSRRKGKQVKSPKKDSTKEQSNISPLVQKTKKRKETSAIKSPTKSPKRTTMKKSPVKRVSRRRGEVVELSVSTPSEKVDTARKNSRKEKATSPMLSEEIQVSDTTPSTPHKRTRNTKAKNKNTSPTKSSNKPTTLRPSRRKVVIVSPASSNKAAANIDSESADATKIESFSSPAKSSRKRRNVLSKSPAKSPITKEPLEITEAPGKLPVRRKRAAAANIGSMKELAANKKLRREDPMTDLVTVSGSIQDNSKIESEASLAKTQTSKTTSTKQKISNQSGKTAKKNSDEIPKKTTKATRGSKKPLSPSPPKRVTRSRK